MENFEFGAPAEMFSAEFGNRKRMTYRRFRTGAEAVQYVIETLGPGKNSNAIIQAGDTRFDRDATRVLYDSANYPLKRQSSD